jgi:hypothetical protein
LQGRFDCPPYAGQTASVFKKKYLLNGEAMILALSGIALLLILLLIAVRIGINKEKTEEGNIPPVIHASGIYSIIRKSPRESISDYKPSQEEIIKYFSNENVDTKNLSLTQADISALIKSWNSQMELNINEIEKGDLKGIEFYYYEYAWNDPICGARIPKGRFVTREEIYQFPSIIPPFHVGCGCRLKKYEGKEKLHDTTELGMLPLFRDGKPPLLPDWKEVLNIRPNKKND